MKILSWNILAHEFIKKGDYPMITGKILFNRKGRLKQIKRLLKKSSADVMLLQEVMPAEYNSLSKTFEKEYYIIKGKNINWYDDKKSSSGNVTFFRKNVFRGPMRIKDLPFGLSVKCYYADQEYENVCENLCAINVNVNSPRSKKTLELELESNAEAELMPIAILNVHLDDLSHGKRIAEIKSLAEEIKGAEKVILGGDFNQDYKPNSHLYKLLNNMGLKIHIKDPTYLIVKKMCIDHLVTKGFEKKACECVVNNFNHDVLQQFKAYGSDHLPVLIQI
jgi:endonuclease/exonuclease/phosphatase family metal-dependent hydrolase